MWVGADRANLIAQTHQVDVFVDPLATTVDHITAHSYISKTQSRYLMNQKENLDSDTCVKMLDFAENYQYVLQDEILSFHWNNSQCSIHPVVIYYKDMSNFLQEKSFAFISENLKHDTAFVYEVMSNVCEYVKGNYQHITKVKYFSDSCAVQYKNYKNLLNPCHHYSDFNLEAKWNFFTTGHGKSAVEGIGRTIKQLTRRTTFQRRYNKVLSAVAAYQFCSKTIENILFNLIENDTLNLF